MAAKKTSKSGASKSGSATARKKPRRRRGGGAVADVPRGRGWDETWERVTGATGATGPSEARPAERGKSDSRRVEFPLPSGRRVRYSMNREEEGGGRVATELQLLLVDARGEVLARSDMTMSTNPGEGPVFTASQDSRKVRDFAPADLVALLEEGAKLLPFPEPLRAQIAELARGLAPGATGATPSPKVIKNGATLLREPEGGARALPHRATIAFDDDGGAKPGWFVLVKHRHGGVDVSTRFVVDEARSMCRGEGDVYEFALDGVSWIVGVPKGGVE